MILARKKYQDIQIFMIFARKINKIPEFYMILKNNCPKNIFPEFIGGSTCSSPLSPVIPSHHFVAKIEI